MESILNALDFLESDFRTRLISNTLSIEAQHRRLNRDLRLHDRTWCISTLDCATVRKWRGGKTLFGALFVYMSRLAASLWCQYFKLGKRAYCNSCDFISFDEFNSLSIIWSLKLNLRTNKTEVWSFAFYVLTGSGWMFYFVIVIQTAINTGVGIGAILLAGECLQVLFNLLMLL